MKQKARRHTGTWIVLFVLAAAVAAYFLFLRQGEQPAGPQPPQRASEPAKAKVERRAVPAETRPVPSSEGTTEPEAEGPAETGGESGLEPRETDSGADACDRIERDVRDFFLYLDDQAYVADLIGDTDAWTAFTRVLAKLGSRPPVPAGEGLDPALMTANIYHLFRVLSDRDIQLTREVIRHEADSLELNMDLLHRWLTLGDRCPDPEGVRPSPDLVYRYAGFFMNTIGGRAYLYRRASWLRLLMSYYAVSILHDTDLDGRNTYGIDVYPLALQVREEIARTPGFHFQKAYLERLDAMAGYYAKHR